MPDRQLIGDILSARRKDLGLSIDRVVAGTKLQRRIIEAFESSDFDAMPAKGYAKATLASYARYLGLDANEIIHIYEEQLYDYERELARSSRSRDSGGDAGYAREGGRSRARGDSYERAPERAGRGQREFGERGSYPARRGYASQTSRGLYADDDREPSSSSYRRSGSSGSARRTYNASSYDRDGRDDRRGASSRGDYGRPASQGSRRSGTYEPDASYGYRGVQTAGGTYGARPTSGRRRVTSDAGRPYSDMHERDMRGFEEDRRSRDEWESREEGHSRSRGGSAGAARGYESDERGLDGRGGRVRRQGYEDDRRRDLSSRRASGAARGDARARRADNVIPFDDGYVGGSGGDASSYGLPSNRGHSTERVRRADVRSRTLDGINGVIVGLQSFFRDNRLAGIVTAAVILLLVVVILVFSISSCVRSSSSSQTTTIPVVTVGSSSAGDASASSTGSSSADATAASSASSGAASTVATASAPAATEATVADVQPSIDLSALPADSVLSFTVSADATVTPWIEITVDGVATYAAQAVAGEVESFTVTQSASMRLSNPDLVTITVNDVVVEPTVDETGMASVSLAVAADQLSQAQADVTGVAADEAVVPTDQADVVAEAAPEAAQ